MKSRSKGQKSLFTQILPTILTVCNVLGLHGGCVTGVVARRGKEHISAEGLRLGEQNAVKVAVKATEILIDSAG